MEPKSNEQALADLYRLLAVSLVEHTDKLTVEPFSTPNSTLLTVKADDEDFGRLIGSCARMHVSCQTILRESIFAQGKLIRLVIDCPETAVRSHNKFKSHPTWGDADDKRSASLICEVARAIYRSPTVDYRRISHSTTQFTLKLNQVHEARDDRVIESLKIWFEAAGRALGRVIYLDVV